ncbi:hypothetical protein ASC66_09930 [Leifsonia sp. Root4]|uniref:ribokinase n=1 Tax=Leifsonia sp. Root4 TaxID=1736525 RepID=UPI0006F68185|nr:ribokinase [Leifsonia sp. Root4]KQW05336.1 hypothetical protein ASC66_09930 [Leifsonia sp. Root4]
MTTATVCVVGSMNADRYLGLARVPQPGETMLGSNLGLYPGGKGLNQAVAAARCGASVRFCGAVGSDIEAEFLRDALAVVEISGEYVATAAGPSGAAYVFSLPGGENSIVVAQGANALLAASDVVSAVRGASVVLTQLEINPDIAATALREARKYSATTVLNAAPAHPATWEMLPDVDILIVNETEAASLGGLDALRPHVTVVYTRGADGVTVYERGGGAIEVAAFVVDPIDTTGAGDAFCGGFVAAVARGASLEAAAREGAAAGAVVAEHRGAQTAALSQEAVRRLVEQRVSA